MIHVNDSCAICPHAIRLWLEGTVTDGEFKGEAYKLPVLGCSMLKASRIITNSEQDFSDAYLSQVWLEA